MQRPDGVDLREIVHRAVAEWPPGAQARVWVADGRATALRRQSAVTASRTLGGRAGDEIAIDIGMQDRLAREIAGYGADAVVLEPQSLRDDVVAQAARAGGREGCMSSVSTRLVRLLNMVPYFQANPRITFDEAATDLGVSVKQLREDLEQLWMCGLPGYSPGDLIDFEMSGKTIEVTFSAGMDHPLRLTSPEATGISVALRALLDVPGMVDPEAARSAIAKIECAAGTAKEGGGAAVDEPAPAESSAAAAVRAAVRDGRALSIDYYSASHDTLSTRIVDPIRVVLVGTTAMSRRGAARPRRCGCSGSTASSTPTCSTSRRRRPSPPCRPGPTPRCSTAIPSLPSATLLVDRTAAWMFDYYPLRVRARTRRRRVRGRDDLCLGRMDGAVRAGIRLRGAGAGSAAAGRAGARRGRDGVAGVRGQSTSKPTGRLKTDFWR